MLIVGNHHLLSDAVFEQIGDVDGFVSFKSICKYLKVGNTLYAE